MAGANRCHAQKLQLVGPTGEALQCGYSRGLSFASAASCPDGTLCLSTKSHQLVRATISPGTGSAVITVLAGRGGSEIRTDRDTYGAPSLGGFADGPAAQARFNSPRGLAVLRCGSVAVVDRGSRRVRLVSAGAGAGAAGVVSTLAGSGFAGLTDGAGETATFGYAEPSSLTGIGT